MGCGPSTQVATTTPTAGSVPEDRFCKCKTDDGNASFICTTCNKIKLRSKNVVKKAIKKSRKKQKLEELNVSNFQDDQGADNDNTERSENEKNSNTIPQISPGKRKNILSDIIDLKMFQEMAFRKVYRDHDTDKNGTLTAPEFRDMVINYQNDTGIYRPPTMVEAEAFIKFADPLAKDCIAEKGFVDSMMEAVYNPFHNSENMESQELCRALKKIEQFGIMVIERLELRALTLYSLFQKYSNTHFVAKKNKWLNNVIDNSDLFRMMNDFAELPKHRPSQNDVFQFMTSMDSSGDMVLQPREFMSYMLHGMVQSKSSIRQFSKRSRMHKKISYFLISLDRRMTDNEKTISIDKKTLKRLLTEINHVLSDDNKGPAMKSVSVADAKRKVSRMDSLTIDDISKLASSAQEHDEMLNIHQSKRDFDARVQRKAVEKSLIHNKQTEHTLQKLKEREKKRVMSLYNPKMLRRAADIMDEGEIKDRILSIVGAAPIEKSPKNNGKGSKRKTKKLKFKREASRRMSVSARNTQRIKSTFEHDQERWKDQVDVIHERQARHAREKLRKKRSYNRKHRKKKADRTIPHPPVADTSASDKHEQLQVPAIVQPPKRILNPGTQAMTLSFGNFRTGRNSDSDSSDGELGMTQFDISSFDMSVSVLFLLLFLCFFFILSRRFPFNFFFFFTVASLPRSRFVPSLSPSYSDSASLSILCKIVFSLGLGVFSSQLSTLSRDIDRALRRAFIFFFFSLVSCFFILERRFFFFLFSLFAF